MSDSKTRGNEVGCLGIFFLGFLEAFFKKKIYYYSCKTMQEVKIAGDNYPFFYTLFYSWDVFIYLELCNLCKFSLAKKCLESVEHQAIFVSLKSERMCVSIIHSKAVYTSAAYFSIDTFF